MVLVRSRVILRRPSSRVAMRASERDGLLNALNASTSDVERASSARDDDDARSRDDDAPRTRNTLSAVAFVALGALCVAAVASSDGTRGARVREIASRAFGGADAAVTDAAAASMALGLAPETERPVEGVNVPTFIHIPKSGGTTIEDVLGKIGINVGCCNPKRPYELRENFKGLESWHTPPATRVENSWAIVRNPYTRAVSEFLWQTNWGNKELFHSLNPGYSVHNCEVFQEYVKNHMWGLTTNALYGCYRQGGFNVDAMAACDAQTQGGLGVGSHWIPQVVMTASADHVFKLEGCFSQHEGMCDDPVRGGSQPNILKFMRQQYDPTVSFDDKVNEWNERVAKPDLMTCWDEFVPEVLNAFNDAYAEDFNRFSYSFIKRDPAVLGNAFTPPEPSVDSMPSLGELQGSLPTGETLQDNVSPRCGGFRPAPPKPT